MDDETLLVAACQLPSWLQKISWLIRAIIDKVKLKPSVSQLSTQVTQPLTKIIIFNLFLRTKGFELIIKGDTEFGSDLKIRANILWNIESTMTI